MIGPDLEPAYVPFLAGAAFGCIAPRLARGLPPAVATWLLSLGALVAAAASSAALALLAFPLIAQAPLLSGLGRWSDAVLRSNDPGPIVGALAAAAVIVLAVRGVRAIAARVLALRDAHRLAAALPPTGELAVLELPERHAFAVPGRPGRIVVSASLLRHLDSEERRALLAHERSHLARRHHLHQAVAVVAAAVNPLLCPVPAAVALASERWADEDAAVSCARGTVAAALVRAALGSAPAASGAILAAGAVDVVERVTALHRPTVRLRWWRLTLLLAVLGAAVVAVLFAAHDTDRLFDLAQAAYGARRS